MASQDADHINFTDSSSSSFPCLNLPKNEPFLHSGMSKTSHSFKRLRIKHKLPDFAWKQVINNQALNSDDLEKATQEKQHSGFKQKMAHSSIV